MLKELKTFLGFAQKAGHVVSGETSVKSHLVKQKIFLLVLAEDSSQSAKDYFLQLGEKMQIPVFTLGTKADLGLAIGKSPRSVVGVKNRGFADKINKLFTGE
ncbi:MAG: L7Ae/L30e/S12e/Gadd45 family ribosomal protein [Bacillota bacterium]